MPHGNTLQDAIKLFTTRKFSKAEWIEVILNLFVQHERGAISISITDITERIQDSTDLVAKARFLDTVMEFAETDRDKTRQILLESFDSIIKQRFNRVTSSPNSQSSSPSASCGTEVSSISELINSSVPLSQSEDGHRVQKIHNIFNNRRFSVPNNILVQDVVKGLQIWNNNNVVEEIRVRNLNFLNFITDSFYKAFGNCIGQKYTVSNRKRFG